MEFKLSQSCSTRTSRYSLFNSICTHKQLHLHVQKCRCQVLGISSNTQAPIKKILVHVVKEGETLASISKLYGVPVRDIAAVNDGVVDLDLVFEGQQLNIPASIAAPVQQGKTEVTRPESCSKRASGLELYSRFLNLKASTLPSFRHLPYAASTSCFLVLVPLIAFCIRCIMVALNNRLAGDLDHNSASEPERIHPRSKRTRWKSALLDLRDPGESDTNLGPVFEGPDESDTNPGPELENLKDDEDQSDYDDHSHTYSKVEEDYQKFLSECGISNWGYWRGGSSK